MVVVGSIYLWLVLYGFGCFWLLPDGGGRFWADLNINVSGAAMD